MPSFLVTEKMNPALAQRVQASLAGDARTRDRSGRTRRVRVWARLLTAAGIATLAAFLLSTYRQSRREVEIARQQLVLQWAEERPERSVDEVEWLRRVEDLVLDEARGDPSDFAVAGLANRLDELMKGGVVYLRSSLRDATARTALRAAASESVPDAFALCLTRPPSTRDETGLLRHLGTAATNSTAPTNGSQRVHSIAAVYARAEFLNSNFIEQVKTTHHMSQLDDLAARWDAAPLRAGRDAARARVFVYVIDEPVPSGAEEDFDGEGPHHMRFGLVDLDDFQLLWRARREVSPDWISDKSRLSFSRPLDSCRLALDLRREELSDAESE